MARIAKAGLEYFPFDIDFFQDIRIRKLIKRQGGKAVTVYTLLLCLIYKHGYYIQWDNELPFIGSEMSGFEEAYISEVLNACLALGLFNKNLFKKHQVLTSKSIQVRYCNIQRLSKRKKLIDKYSLLEDSQPVSTELPPDEANNPSEKTDRPEANAEPITSQPEAPTSKQEDNAKWLKEFFGENNKENLQLLCKNFGLPPNSIGRLHTLAEAVITEWELSHTPHRDYNDWSRHLISSMRIKLRNEVKDNPNADNTSAAEKSDYTFNGGFGSIDT